MSISSSLHFTYDGISSEEMGLLNVNTKGGLYTEPFLASRSINEITVRGKRKPYFVDTIEEPLTFSFSFLFNEGYNTEKIRKVTRWLKQSYYKPLIFSDSPERVFYCLCVDESQLIHNGLQQGYVELTMRCDAPHSYSPFYTSPIYDSTVESIIEFQNNSDDILLPEISIEKINSAGDISIINLSNAGEEMTFTDLGDTEQLYVDCENEYIETDAPMIYRYDNHNGYYLELLPQSINRLSLVGDFKIQFRYRYIILQG